LLYLVAVRLDWLEQERWARTDERCLVRLRLRVVRDRLRQGGVRSRQRLVIAMEPKQFSRQQVVDVLRHAGWPDLADEALRTLPDPVDSTRLEEWGIQHDVSYDVLQSRFGGSP
jgi:hypothetical protein